MKKQEGRTRQWLSEIINKVITARDEFDAQITTKYTAPNIMIVDFNVLSSGMENGIRSQNNGRIIVTLENRNVRQEESELSKQSAKPSQFCSSGSQGTVLSLCGRS